MTSPDYYIPSNSDYDSYYIDSPDASQQQSHISNKIMVVAIVILSCTVFFLTSLNICGKWAWRSYNRNSNRMRFLHQNQANSDSRSSGLSKDSIAQLPTFTYKAPPASSDDLEAGENVGMLECAVCLSNFQEDEKGRLLPTCKHSFHIECIDMWFYSHSTCPLCRAVVMPTITTSPVMPITISTHELHEGAEELALHGAQNAIGATSSARESNPLNAIAIAAAGDNVANAMVQIPTNVLFCGDSIQSVPSRLDASQSAEKPSSSSSSSRATRCVPHITLEIPTSLDISLTSPGCISTLSSRRSRHASPSPHEPACSSDLKSLKSPGLRGSVKRMLSIQSSREKRVFTSLSPEGNMESPR